MTIQEAKAKQEELSKHYRLSYWYGTNCKKCCEVFPKFRTSSGYDSKCWYECEVCGTKTKPASMPWIAEKEWNEGDYMETQYSIF